jgi:hypothetical protein
VGVVHNSAACTARYAPRLFSFCEGVAFVVLFSFGLALGVAHIAIDTASFKFDIPCPNAFFEAMYSGVCGGK